jgi:hypothetical protein
MNPIQKYKQVELEIKVVTSKEVDGVEMGVLSDGTPFLTGRGLAKACGISNGTLSEWGEITPALGSDLRAGKMAELLAANGFGGDKFFQRIVNESKEGVDAFINAYPDAVCTAFLEYYAFEAGRYCTETAKTNFRILCRERLRDFIYKKTGYDPRTIALQSWKCFHDRLLLNTVPSGFFSVFTETAQLVVSAIRGGLTVDEHTVPDISVGKVWSKFWDDNNLESTYGGKMSYPHDYPDYFPQAQANGSITAYIYPLKALGEFREWVENHYLPSKFPSYLQRKVKQGAISGDRAQSLLKAVEPVALPPAHPTV